ncbi:DUF4251 domain-containing protein [Millionella massiliensis]|uniref:DUF4251 domain-containing protein n=1 Tax=Millionella massiliensis TaxID=1871023 RepID=UPI0008DAB215|nr:DUF4251 domain-containing protein [Millionella massiliensis]
MKTKLFVSAAALFGSLGLLSGYAAHAEGVAVAAEPFPPSRPEGMKSVSEPLNGPAFNAIVPDRLADVEAEPVYLLNTDPAVVVAATGDAVAVPADDRRSKRQQQRAQQAEAAARRVDSLLTSRRFLFVPSRVVTQLPGTPYVTLTTYYEVAVTPDSVACTLPYYGYVYNTISNPDRSPFYFTAANPEISQEGTAAGKERAWVTVTAREKFNQRVYVLTFEVFDSGEASLTIQGSGTQHLQFLGNIEPIPAGQPTAINPEIL